MVGAGLAARQPLDTDANLSESKSLPTQMPARDRQIQ